MYRLFSEVSADYADTLQLIIVDNEIPEEISADYPSPSSSPSPRATDSSGAPGPLRRTQPSNKHISDRSSNVCHYLHAPRLWGVPPR
jgi:hypothetical protein